MIRAEVARAAIETAKVAPRCGCPLTALGVLVAAADRIEAGL